MTNEKKDIISHSLGLEPIEKKTKMKQIEHSVYNNLEVDSEYEYARKNIYDIIERGTSALDYAIDLASSDESPKSLEIVNELIKTMIAANKNLLDLKRQNKEIEKLHEPKEQPSVTNNNLILTTGDLLKMIKDSNKE
jgi:hypothetical protein